MVLTIKDKEMIKPKSVKLSTETHYTLNQAKAVYIKLHPTLKKHTDDSTILWALEYVLKAIGGKT